MNVSNKEKALAIVYCSLVGSTTRVVNRGGEFSIPHVNNKKKKHRNVSWMVVE
jgi:hypothetical protein